MRGETKVCSELASGGAPGGCWPAGLGGEGGKGNLDAGAALCCCSVRRSCRWWAWPVVIDVDEEIVDERTERGGPRR